MHILVAQSSHPSPPGPSGACLGQGALSASAPCSPAARPQHARCRAELAGEPCRLMQPGITTFPQLPPRQYSPPLEARKVCGERERRGWGEEREGGHGGREVSRGVREDRPHELEREQGREAGAERPLVAAGQGRAGGCRGRSRGDSEATGWGQGSKKERREGQRRVGPFSPPRCNLSVWGL